MSVHLLGVPEFEAALTANVAAIAAATNKGVASAAHLVEAEAKKKLTTYSHPKGTPTPSPPGQPPAIISGGLRRSVKTEVTARAGAGSPISSAKIGPTAVQGRIQELGGRCGRGHATMLPPRPYMAPTLRTLEQSGRLEQAFRDAWAAGLEVS